MQQLSVNEMKFKSFVNEMKKHGLSFLQGRCHDVIMNVLYLRAKLQKTISCEEH